MVQRALTTITDYIDASTSHNGSREVTTQAHKMENARVSPVGRVSSRLIVDSYDRRQDASRGVIA